jgi:subtilisin family serine protease
LKLHAIIVSFCLLFCSLAGLADEPKAARILVTFTDAGITKSAPTGPASPVYRRGRTSYLTSVGVSRAVRRIEKEFQLEKLDEWPIAPLEVHCVVFGLTTAANTAELLAALNLRADVESAQLLEDFDIYAVSRADLADPYSELQHVLATLEIPQAHAWSMGTGVSVTIIDTGADLDHPELRHQIDAHEDFVTESSGDFSADAHGTAIAGIISAAADNSEGIIGIAPEARLSIFKACWYGTGRARAHCNSFTLAKALSRAIESGTDIINLSLGGPPDMLLERLVREALRRNIFVVAAAQPTSTPGFPGNIDGVFVVEESGIGLPAGELRQTRISAPGSEILVAVPDGGYDFASGSSLAAAHVSGVIALLIAIEPDLGADEIHSLLTTSRYSESGPVNACRALARLLETSGCNNLVRNSADNTTLQGDGYRKDKLRTGRY